MTEQTRQSDAVSAARAVDVSWDLGVGLISAVGDMPDALFSTGGEVQIRFVSRLSISLDTSARPVALGVFDIPQVLVGIIPPARRGEDDVSGTPPGTIPWLLDTDNDWVWITLIEAPTHQRLVREGWVEVWLHQDRLVCLKVRAQVAGAFTRAKQSMP
ncbi:hypothetical protein [Streptomyces sp. NPDC058330]|uniref:hypothetical protein n=1 Tax=Streptomyces sp. NPDC058330 TaxID=3346449 RepID=UPI0036ECE02E